MRGLERVVVGDVSNTSGNEALLKEKGIQMIFLRTRWVSIYMPGFAGKNLIRNLKIGKA